MKINESITYVGKTDWELRKFHGDEYSTHKGSTYNSYLVRDEKTVLIDTVWQPFSKEFVKNLKSEIDLKEIDYIVINHGEIDHSGALTELMREIPDTPIYCTQMGVKSLKGHYHQDWNFVPVKTGDRLSLGKKELIFIEARFLHWPDTMFSYLTEDNVLFSTDAFGQHYCSEKMFNDLVDPSELKQEAIKYYANILTPFNTFIDKKLQEVLALDLPIDMICPSHGVIWRENPLEIVKTYEKWCKDYQENLITVVYDSMWESTRSMAEQIVKGIASVDKDVVVKLYNISKADKNDVITEIFKSKAIIMGSSTINNGILSKVAALIEEIKGMKFKKKKAYAFGSYGWSGEAIKIIDEELQKAGFEVDAKGIKVNWVPDEEGLKNSFDYGVLIAETNRK